MFSRNRVFFAALGAAVFAGSCFAQTYTTYGVVSSPQTPGLYYGNTYAVDLNNDGVPDLVMNEYSSSANLQPDFAVFIANRDGTFKAPVLYAYSPSSIPPGNTGPGAVPMTFGDFNGDGNVDIAMPVGNHTIAVYLGKGDGTLANPWYSVLNLPSNQYVSFYPTMVASDFNHDGKMDLTVAAINTDGSGQTVYVLPGQGNGLFSTATAVLTYANPGNGGSWGVQQVLRGDFDGDTNADLAIAISSGDRSGGFGSTTEHVLYGTGAFSFEDTTPIMSYTGSPLLSAGDLNSDGKSDLYGLDPNTFRLNTYYGQGDRTLASYTQSLPAAEYTTSTMGMADFNDDGRNDIAAMATTYTSSFLVFFLATSSPGQFELQTWNVSNAAVPVVGDFNHDGKPDWAYVGNTSSGYSIAYSGLNGTTGQLWSNCDYPNAQRGINLCSPAMVSGSTVNFNAAAHSLGDVRKLELWVDGKKLGEQYHTWEGNAFFSASSTLASGTHSGTYYAADIDNSLQRYDFQFTVPSNCSAPSTPGVHLCWPSNGASINATSVMVDATATVTGTLARMEVWVDSVKKYTETNSTSLSAAVTVTPGTHRFTVYAVNTNGTVWSQAATATIP